MHTRHSLEVAIRRELMLGEGADIVVAALIQGECHRRFEDRTRPYPQRVARFYDDEEIRSRVRVEHEQNWEIDVFGHPLVSIYPSLMPNAAAVYKAIPRGWAYKLDGEIVEKAA